jgi:hypothetical protein
MAFKEILNSIYRGGFMMVNIRAEQDPRDKLRQAMTIYRIPEQAMALQLNISVSTVRAFLNGISTPAYVEKRIEEWLE